MTVYDRVRHPAAQEAAEHRPAAESFDGLKGHKYCLLVSYRKDGTPMPTPVWFGMAGGKVYTRTRRENWKVKRIRRNPRVLVGPCDWHRKPHGPLAEGRARVLTPDEEAVAEAALRLNYGLGRRVYRLVVDRGGGESAYIEIAPNPEVDL